jgi:hypothetical protein
LLNTPTDQQTRDELRRFYEEQQVIWGEVSRRWIEFRRLDTNARVAPHAGGNTPGSLVP